MKRIGKVESSTEDPNFKAILSAMEKLKLELKEFQFHTNAAAQAGKTYTAAIEHFCGSSVKGEKLYNKEDSFVRAIQERFAPTLDHLVTIEIPKMEELVVAYKTAKLKFDSTYSQTVKDMRKKEIAGSDKHEEVMKFNDRLPVLQKGYFDSKKEIINQQNVLKGRLENEVSSALLEVLAASDAEHHQLYVDFMERRIVRTAAICKGTAVVGQTEIDEQKRENVDAELQNDREGQIQHSELQQGDEKGNPFTSVGQEESDNGTKDQNTEDIIKNPFRNPGEDIDTNPFRKPGGALVSEEEKGMELDFGSGNNIPDLEEDEEDIPKPPSRKAPDVPQELLTNSSQEVLQPPAPPTT